MQGLGPVATGVSTIGPCPPPSAEKFFTVDMLNFENLGYAPLSDFLDTPMPVAAEGGSNAPGRTERGTQKRWKNDFKWKIIFIYKLSGGALDGLSGGGERPKMVIVLIFRIFHTYFILWGASAPTRSYAITLTRDHEPPPPFSAQLFFYLSILVQDVKN